MWAVGERRLRGRCRPRPDTGDKSTEETNDMAIVLYELCGADDLRFSPYCWRTRLALAQKGLDYTTEPVRFTDKPKIAFSGQGRVPVIDDGGKVVFDSWTIAEHLEDAYPDRPTLFPGARGRQYAKMTQDWMNALHPEIVRSIIFDIYSRLDPADHVYFRESREKLLGGKLEDIQAGREQSREHFRDGFASMRAHLMDQPFVSGAAPAYADFIVFGSLKWADLCSDFKLFAADDPISTWYARVGAEMGVG